MHGAEAGGEFGVAERLGQPRQIGRDAFRLGIARHDQGDDRDPLALYDAPPWLSLHHPIRVGTPPPASRAEGHRPIAYGSNSDDGKRVAGTDFTVRDVYNAVAGRRLSPSSRRPRLQVRPMLSTRPQCDDRIDVGQAVVRARRAGQQRQQRDQPRAFSDRRGMAIGRHRVREPRTDRKSTRLNSSHMVQSRMPSSA